MMYIESPDIVTAAKDAFLRVYDGEANESDELIWREDTAVISVTQPEASEPAFVLSEGRLCYVQDYARYIPSIEPDLVRLEENHYTDILVDTGHIDTIVEHLTSHPDSRRGVANNWAMEHLDLSREAPCLTALYFRMYMGRLAVHAHARACNAYNLLLLDMQLVGSVQNEVAQQLGVPVGVYTHFIDSLHLYKRDLPDIEAQRTYMQSSPSWQHNAKGEI